MRIAVTSDIHLGDPTSTMAFRNESGKIEIGSRYNVDDNGGNQIYQYLLN